MGFRLLRKKDVNVCFGMRVFGAPSDAVALQAAAHHVPHIHSYLLTRATMNSNSAFASRVMVGHWHDVAFTPSGSGC